MAIDVRAARSLASAILAQAVKDGAREWLETEAAGFWFDVAGLNQDAFNESLTRREEAGEPVEVTPRFISGLRCA